MPKSSNGGEQGHNFFDLALNGLDDTTTPAIVSFGQLGKDSGGTWRYMAVSSSGYLMVSGSFASGTFTSSPLSADSSSISAKSGDAGLFRVSALGAAVVGGTFTNGQISILSAAATQVVAPNTARTQGVVISNISTQPIYFGNSAVTSALGLYLVGIPGATLVIPTTSAVYGIVSGTAQSISYMEL